MLKIDRVNGHLARLPTSSLAEASILERHGLQRMIVGNPEAFFDEMGEKLLLIGQEVRPSDHVNDSIDLLAIDQSGASVVIELKRDEQKLQLLQAISYAAMLSDWDGDDFVRELSTFSAEPEDAAREAINDHLASNEASRLNEVQRIILVAETFDYSVLKSAEWLSESYGLRIRCYRLSYASDDASEYLTCTCVYPPPEIADQSARARRTRPLQQTGAPQTWESILEGVKNPDAASFFRTRLAERVENRPRQKQLIFRIGDRRWFYMSARRKHGWVWQDGRFDGDLEFWRKKLSVPEKVNAVKDDTCLSFTLITARDFEVFARALSDTIPTSNLRAPEVGGPPEEPRVEEDRAAD